MKIKALIAVRSGSVRVQNKNIKPFAESTLLELKIKQLLRVPELDGIIINSNDEHMLEIGKKYGVETVKRDSYYASNEVSMSDVYQNMAENVNSEIIMYANVTNPLVYDATYTKCIMEFFDMNKKFDSLNSAHAVKEFMFLNNQPINYELGNQPRSQDLPDIYALNFAISILSKENMIKNRNVVGNTPYLFPMDEIEALDIDTPLDFEIGEFLYKKNDKF